MKRFLILFLVLAVSVAFFGCGRSGTSSAVPQEVRVLLGNQPFGEMLRPLFPEFERETGIRVIWESLQEFQLSNKLVTEFATGLSSVDVFMTRPLQEAMLFNKNNWNAPLTAYDFSDYPRSAVELGVKDGVPHIVPLIVEWQVLYYRIDLFERAGLRPPATFAELENAARVLHSEDIAGFGIRGAPFASIPPLSSFIFGFGGRYLENGQAVFDSPQAVEAFRYYGRMLGTYGPQGISSMSWEQLLPIFQAGRLAMWIDVPIFYPQTVNPAQSTVPVENVGIATFPAGPARDNPFVIVPWGMAIASGARDMNIAMRFLNWSTSKEMATAALRSGIQVARNSPWDDPQIRADIHPGILESMSHAFAVGHPSDRPLMTSIAAARDLIGEVVLESIETRGTSPRLQALATQKASEVNDLLRADGEYSAR